jgi:integrase
MGILAEKRAGKTTGKFRVELQRTVDGQQERYRHRHDTFAAAQADEARVRSMWAQGVAQDVVKTYQTTGGPLTLSEAIPLVKRDSRVWKGQASEETTWQRMAIIEAFMGKEALETIDIRSVNRLIQHLEDNKRSLSTINRYMSHLKTFLDTCIALELRTAPLKDKMFSWADEKGSERIRFISREEEQRIYEYLESRERPEASAVRALIEVAIQTGCRRDELLTARISQINGHLLTLWHTKTKTPRTIPMTPRTTALLTDLIVSGSMPTRRGLRSWWNRVREHLGLQEELDFVFHSCRHTCATRLLEAGVNLYVIKEWMGHSVIETTLRYAHMQPKNLEQALVRLGNYVAGGLKEANLSEGFGVPQHVPHGGEYAQIRA